jgi:hypothetical protein
MENLEVGTFLFGEPNRWDRSKVPQVKQVPGCRKNIPKRETQ